MFVPFPGVLFEFPYWPSGTFPFSGPKKLVEPPFTKNSPVTSAPSRERASDDPALPVMAANSARANTHATLLNRRHVIRRHLLVVGEVPGSWQSACQSVKLLILKNDAIPTPSSCKLS